MSAPEPDFEIPAFLLRSAPGTQPFKDEPPVAAITSETQTAIATTWKDPIMTAAPTPAPTAARPARKPRRDIYTTTITITMPVDMKQPETVRAALDAAERLPDLFYGVPEGSTIRVASAFGKLSAE